MSLKNCVSVLFLAAALCQEVYPQAFTSNDYKKALWMTTRFYGGQRSGDNNWLLYNHLPSGVPAALRGRAFRADAHSDGTDLSGGWHDCGDHVKFGQTQFYSAYLLLKGYAEFPTGYDDRYSYDYAGYKASGQWNFEGSGHDPNCIPDVLDEVKHATDFFIKCTPDASNFYYQVGNGGAGADHAYWETAVKLQTRAANTGNNDNGTTAGPLRPACKNPNDGSMASFAGATLALMARVYAPYDAAYASLCLTHAMNAYNYARTRLGNTASTCFGGFYGAARDSRDAFVCLCTELYYTTGNTAYRTEAFGHEAGVIVNAGWSFDYANCGEIGLYCLAQMGNANATTKFNSRVTGHFLTARTGGLYNGGNATWGALRYNANAAFMIALYSKLNNNTTATVINAIHADIDYIMGSNSSSRSFVVGFTPSGGGYTAAQKPHHRNVYLRDDNPANGDNSLTIPAKNQQFGALVGGTRNPGSYNDVREDYQYTEVCIDYNVGLVGALGFINARLAPVTIDCGASSCREPDLGPDISTCSTSLPVVLDANAGNPGGAISYKWYTWNGTTKTQIGGATGRTYSANAVGAYIVERDSSLSPDPGSCTKSDTIWITNTIATPNLGADPDALCDPATIDLTPSNVASFPGGTTWQWYEASVLAGPYNTITGATSSTLSNVREAGYYKVIATAGSCESEDIVHVTSNLPTPVDGCRSGTGTVNLAITNPGLNGTNYNWYAAATGGSPLAGGTGTTTFTTPSISTTTTYYVQDMSAAAGNVGPTTLLGTSNNWGLNTGNHLHFTANTNFSINSLKIPWYIYGNTTGQIQIEILDGSGNPLVPAQIFTSNPETVTTAQHGQLIQFEFTGFTIQSSWGPNLRMRIVDKGLINGDPLWSGGPASYGSYCYPSCGSPIVSITGESGGDGDSNDYMYFYDWDISTGTPCARLPVVAIIGSCSLPVELVSFFANNNSDHVYLGWSTATEVNNDRFEIERSADGEHFQVIATLSGNGTKNSLSNYSYMDFEPLAGISYYRLAQYDSDGTLTYSHVVAVERENQSAISVVPNPFTNSADLVISSAFHTEISVKVTDLTGKVLWSSHEYSTNEVIPVGAELPKGVYIVQVNYNDKVYTARIVKQ